MGWLQEAQEVMHEQTNSEDEEKAFALKKSRVVPPARSVLSRWMEKECQHYY